MNFLASFLSILAKLYKKVRLLLWKHRIVGQFVAYDEGRQYGCVEAIRFSQGTVWFKMDGAMFNSRSGWRCVEQLRAMSDREVWEEAEKASRERPRRAKREQRERLIKLVR